MGEKNNILNIKGKVLGLCFSSAKYNHGSVGSWQPEDNHGDQNKLKSKLRTAD